MSTQDDNLIIHLKLQNNKLNQQTYPFTPHTYYHISLEFIAFNRQDLHKHPHHGQKSIWQAHKHAYVISHSIIQIYLTFVRNLYSFLNLQKALTKILFLDVVF